MSSAITGHRPKKYFTLRFDDGITQDARVMEILRRYNTHACTFYLNSGLLGAEWAWVGQVLGCPELSHRRYDRATLETGVYRGFDVQAHTATHTSLKNLTDEQVTAEVGGDAAALSEWLGYTPVGLAWPGGDTEWNESNVETVYRTTPIRYGSCTTRTGGFALPTYFLTWYPTCCFSDADAMDIVERFIAEPADEDKLCFLWCHSYELDLYHTWDRFEVLIRRITEAAAQDETLELVTNAEFYEKFKDRIPSWKD